MSDHKAEAEEWIDYADNDRKGASAALAQQATAHAVLYLAEQQRIGNLITWVSLPDVVTCAEKLPFDKTLAAPVRQRNEVRRTIREGLGL